MRAESICPLCGRMACIRACSASTTPFCASKLMAAAMSATLRSSSASYTVSAPTAVMNCVPLMSASPSFCVSSRVGMPAARIASAPLISSPRYAALPRPSSGSTMCARGTRSPLAPSEPFSGTSGVTPRLSISTRARTVSKRMPE